MGTGTQQYLDLGALKLTGLGRLTCFVGYCVGFGHRLLITQVDGGAPLEGRAQKPEVRALCSKNDAGVLWLEQSEGSPAAHQEVADGAGSMKTLMVAVMLSVVRRAAVFQSFSARYLNFNSLIENSVHDSRLQHVIRLFFCIPKTIRGLKPAADTQSNALSSRARTRKQYETRNNSA